MFDTVLVANRGEIACRVINTLRRLGIRAVAVFTDADAEAPHVRAADIAVRIESYLAIPAVIDAARATGAQAVHPGYGFLSENTAFAAACEEAGIVFVGPPSSAIEAMGDKIRAKQTVAKAGVPVVPGSDGAGLDDAALALAVEQVGYPVLLKPSAGGGGKGMREVHRAEDLADAIASARREARGSFGDDTLLVERLIRNPRHIEIQVMADTHGNVIHLGERECSLQRRHQKIIEEAPSPLLTDEQREAMGAAAVEAARAVGYTGAGTVEFIVDGHDPDQWFFMEMNTRLQVEHPVTEEVYGADLVAVQVRVAAGEAEPWGTLRRRGHAIEARIYAETASIIDGAAAFLPTGGRILRLRWPEGVRVDAGVAEGGVVGSAYDPMLAKVIAWGHDRDEALRALHTALGRTVLLGLDTNIGFLRALLADPDVRAGRLDTGLVGRRIDALAAADVPADVLPAAAVHALAELEPGGPVVDPFDVPGGWRVGAPAWTTWRMAVAGRDPVEVRARGRAADAVVEVRQPVALRDAGPATDHGDGAPQAADGLRDAGPATDHGDGAPQAAAANPNSAIGGAAGHSGAGAEQAPAAATVGGAAGHSGTGAEQAAAAATVGGAAGFVGAGAGPRTATAEAGQAPVRASGRLDGDRLTVTLDGVTRAYTVALDGDTLWLGRDGHAWAVHEQGPVDAVAAETTGAGGPVRSPMPGTVTVVEVAEGQTVTAGDRLVVVEAMKMEHVLTAPVDGVVRDLRAKAGATVAKDAVLLTVDAEEQ